MNYLANNLGMLLTEAMKRPQARIPMVQSEADDRAVHE